MPISCTLGMGLYCREHTDFFLPQFLSSELSPQSFSPLHSNLLAMQRPSQETATLTTNDHLRKYLLIWNMSTLNFKGRLRQVFIMFDKKLGNMEMEWQTDVFPYFLGLQESGYNYLVTVELIVLNKGNNSRIPLPLQWACCGNHLL